MSSLKPADTLYEKTQLVLKMLEGEIRFKLCIELPFLLQESDSVDEPQQAEAGR